VSALRAELVRDATHWERRLANPPPNANEDFYRSTTQLRDDAVADLGWLDAQLEGHLKRKEPPYRLFQRWRERRVGHRDRAIRNALSRTTEILRQRYLSPRTKPSHEEINAAAAAVLGAVQASVPVTTPAPRIQNVSKRARRNTTASFRALTRRLDVHQACRGELDEVDGKAVSFWASARFGAAVLLSRAGVPMTPRAIFEAYA
jgi:hypothetical protein